MPPLPSSPEPSDASPLAAATLPQAASAQRLINEHEMGELFKVLALARGVSFEPLGFVRGDRSHRL